MQDEERNLLKRNNNGDTDEETVFCKDEHCTGTLKKRISTRSTRKGNNQLPRIHEDYCGPRHHRPSHH